MSVSIFAFEFLVLKLFWIPFEGQWWFCSVCPSIISWLIQSSDRTQSLWPYPSCQFLILPKFCIFSCLIHRSHRSNCVLSSAESITVVVVKGSLARDFKLLVFSWINSRGPWVSHRAISNFYENPSNRRRYLQLDFGDKLFSVFTDVNDTGNKTVGQISVCLHHKMNVLKEIQALQPS